MDKQKGQIQNSLILGKQSILNAQNVQIEQYLNNTQFVGSISGENFVWNIPQFIQMVNSFDNDREQILNPYWLDYYFKNFNPDFAFFMRKDEDNIMATNSFILNYSDIPNITDPSLNQTYLVNKAQINSMISYQINQQDFTNYLKKNTSNQLSISGEILVDSSYQFIQDNVLISKKYLQDQIANIDFSIYMRKTANSNLDMINQYKVINYPNLTSNIDNSDPYVLMNKNQILNAIYYFIGNDTRTVRNDYQNNNQLLENISIKYNSTFNNYDSNTLITYNKADNMITQAINSLDFSKFVKKDSINIMEAGKYINMDNSFNSYQDDTLISKKYAIEQIQYYIGQQDFTTFLRTNVTKTLASDIIINYDSSMANANIGYNTLMTPKYLSYYLTNYEYITLTALNQTLLNYVKKDSSDDQALTNGTTISYDASTSIINDYQLVTKKFCDDTYINGSNVMKVNQNNTMQLDGFGNPYRIYYNNQNIEIIDNNTLTHKKYVDDTIITSISNCLVSTSNGIMQNGYFLYYDSISNDNKIPKMSDLNQYELVSNNYKIICSDNNSTPTYYIYVQQQGSSSLNDRNIYSIKDQDNNLMQQIYTPYHSGLLSNQFRFSKISLLYNYGNLPYNEYVQIFSDSTNHNGAVLFTTTQQSNNSFVRHVLEIQQNKVNVGSDIEVLNNAKIYNNKSNFSTSDETNKEYIRTCDLYQMCADRQRSIFPYISMYGFTLGNLQDQNLIIQTGTQTGSTSSTYVFYYENQYDNTFQNRLVLKGSYLDSNLNRQYPSYLYYGFNYNTNQTWISMQANNAYNFSDRRLKRNIKKIELSEDDIIIKIFDKLDIYSYIDNLSNMNTVSIMLQDIIIEEQVKNFLFDNMIIREQKINDKHNPDETPYYQINFNAFFILHIHYCQLIQNKNRKQDNQINKLNKCVDLLQDSLTECQQQIIQQQSQINDLTVKIDQILQIMNTKETLIKSTISTQQEETLKQQNSLQQIQELVSKIQNNNSKIDQIQQNETKKKENTIKSSSTSSSWLNKKYNIKK